MINWSTVKDRHLEGSCPLGKVYIRLNKEGVVDSIYTCFGSTKKYLPENGYDKELEGMKMRAEEIVKVNLL